MGNSKNTLMKATLRIFLSVLMMGVLTNTYSQEKTEIIFHKPANPERAKAPFSEAVQAGNLFFLAGQIGMDRSVGKLADGGIQGETEQTIKNIQGVLKHHGLSLDNVVKCTVILSDINDFKAFNEIYTQYFTNKPARTTFAAKDLAAGAKIEIEVMAIR